jgi:DNA-binding LytR/AlgR family response regulator
MRIHRSHVVNIGCVESIRGRTLLAAGEELPIGASFKNEAMKRWKEPR